MIKLNSLLLGIAAFSIAHILTFIQLNGQFIWKSFQKHEWAVALFGAVLSFFYIWGTKYTVEGMGGLFWPTRFIGFSIGISTYALGVSYFFEEGITTKTFISLILCIVLICVQIFYK